MRFSDKMLLCCVSFAAAAAFSLTFAVSGDLLPAHLNFPAAAAALGLLLGLMLAVPLWLSVFHWEDPDLRDLFSIKKGD